MACRTLIAASQCCLFATLAAVFLWAAPVEALVIYRFGGEELPLPADAEEPGVRFEQLSWEDVSESEGGRTFEVYIASERIAALERNPTVNIAPTAELEGGRYWQGEVTGDAWDGDEGTVWSATPYLCATTRSAHLRCNDDFGSLGTASVIFGSLYQIDRIRVISGLNDPSRVVQAVRVFVSREPPGWPWHPANPAYPFDEWLAEVRDNREQVLDIPIPPHSEIGYLQVALQEHVDPWEVNEIEIYAKGFVQRSTYVTNILDFGGPMALGELRWSGAKGDKAVVQIQTRTGHDDDPVRFWRYTGRGLGVREEVPRLDYPGLSPGERAGTTEDQQSWSLWSAYQFADSLGAPMVSPSPRRYFQARVDFVPRDDDGGQVEWLEFRTSAPVATSLVGEVWPAQARVGEITTFTYALRPTIGTSDPGFDRLELRSQSPLGAVQSVRVGDVDVPYVVEVSGAHKVVVSLPRMGPKDSGALVEMEFESRVLRYGLRFEARVWDSEHPLEVSQTVVAGDASGEYEGNRVTVATSGGRRALLRVEVSPALTPNGDGNNDVGAVDYEVLEITKNASVLVEILDLSSRRVRVLESGPLGIGQYRTEWDGRDQAGRLMPPGIYLCRVEAVTDAEGAARIGLMHLAY